MIISLPISVKNLRPVGYWLTPVFIDALSLCMAETGIIHYGKLGLQAPNKEEEYKFQQNLNFLNINASRRTDAEYSSILKDLALDVLNKYNTVSRKIDCFTCLCGTLSIPREIVTYAKQKTFTKHNDKIICKLCDNESIISEQTLLYYLPQSTALLNSITIYPKMYQNEANGITSQLCDRGIPISKTRQTGFVFRKWNLDVEFLWSFLPIALSRTSGERLRIVITNQVLQQAITALMLCLELNKSFKADLIVLPIISHPGKKEKWNLDRLKTLGYDGNLTRLVLLGSMGWHRKEATLNDSFITIEHRKFNLFTTAVQNTEHKQRDLASVFYNLSQQNISKGLKNAFNPDCFDYSVLRGLFNMPPA